MKPARMNNSYQSILKTLSSLYPVPTPVLKIAEDEGLEVIYDDYEKDTFDGMTWYDVEKEKFFIHINTARGNTQDNTKGRFTLAHELGHYYIDDHRRALESGLMQPHIHRYEPFGKNEEWIIEREADDFAASLLMPEEQFRNDLQNSPFSGQLIQTLAKNYHVSFSSCALRYLSMELIPVMLIFAKEGIIKWQMESQNFPFRRMRYGTSKVPENTVMGQYFYNQDTNDIKKSEIVWAGDCFDTYTEEQNTIQFYEYCIPYKDAAFSMFWEK